MFLLVRNCPRRFQRPFRRHLYYTKLIHGSEDGTQQHIFLMKAYKNTLPASKNNKSCLKLFRFSCISLEIMSLVVAFAY